VNQLCTEIRPHALDLVDAFGVPDQWAGTIGQPTGTRDSAPA
jgi:acyl-CoA oxidase